MHLSLLSLLVCRIIEFEFLTTRAGETYSMKSTTRVPQALQLQSQGSHLDAALFSVVLAGLVRPIRLQQLAVR